MEERLQKILAAAGVAPAAKQKNYYGRSRPRER